MTMMHTGGKGRASRWLWAAVLAVALVAFYDVVWGL